jgi:hypothetical protein
MRLALGAIICFVTAGLAESFTVFQITFLSLSLILAWLSLSGALRRQFLKFLLAGWIATFASFILQLQSSGVANRNAFIAADEVVRPVTLLSDLAPQTINETFGFLASPEIFAGFWLMVGLGALVALENSRPVSLPAKTRQLSVGKSLLFWNIVFQLVCAPFLWSYTSGDAQLFGRFSVRYAPFLAANIGAIVLCFILLWKWDRFWSLLSYRRQNLIRVVGVAFLFICVLLAIEIMAVRIFAWLYLLTSVLLLLTSILREQFYDGPFITPVRAGMTLLLCLVIVWICQASIVATLLYVRGAAYVRTMTPGPYLLMFTGAIFGYCLGDLAKREFGLSGKRQQKVRLIRSALFLGIVMLAGGLTFGQVALIPEIQSYAEQWDKNHAKIIALRDSGQTSIKVEPLPKGFGAYMAPHDAKCYYGVSVEVTSRT